MLENLRSDLETYFYAIDPNESIVNKDRINEIIEIFNLNNTETNLNTLLTKQNEILFEQVIALDKIAYYLECKL